MANDQDRRAVWGVADVAAPVWVRAAACRMIGELLAERQIVGTWPALVQESDSEFTNRLIRRELELIANGEDPLRILLSITLFRTAWNVLVTRAAIRALPEAPPRPIPPPGENSNSSLKTMYNPPPGRGDATAAFAGVAGWRIELSGAGDVLPCAPDDRDSAAPQVGRT